MSATALKEFCREYGIDEKNENLVEEIFSALTGGRKYRKSYRVKPEREKKQASISNGGARTPDG